MSELSAANYGYFGDTKAATVLMATRRLQGTEPEGRMLGASKLTLGPYRNYNHCPAVILFVRTPNISYCKVDAP